MITLLADDDIPEIGEVVLVPERPYYRQYNDIDLKEYRVVMHSDSSNELLLEPLED